MNEISPGFLPPRKAERPYTISEINEGVRDIVEAGNTVVWVEGEISNFKRASSGHCYLRLKDASSQLPAVIWRSAAEALDFEPEEGMQIVAIASIRVYVRGGYYQLDLHRVHPAGWGALFGAFERLKAKLEAEGLFDPARKKPLPRRIARLGVITSGTGAAIRDIVKVAWSRSRRVDIVLLDVPVQGDGAAEKIAQAVADMNAYGKVDCIIVGRGGGSLEDLWAFNEETVARAIAASNIPVISAVGHEIDFTIADFAADFRAPTPSSAAEMAVADDEQDRRYFLAGARHLVTAFNRRYSEARGAYARIVKRTEWKKPIRFVKDGRQALDDLKGRKERALLSAFRHFRDRYAHAAVHLHSLSPLRTMARGYSVISKEDGAVITDSAQVAVGEKVRIEFRRGGARAAITGRTGDLPRDAGEK